MIWNTTTQWHRFVAMMEYFHWFTVGPSTRLMQPFTGQPDWIIYCAFEWVFPEWFQSDTQISSFVRFINSIDDFSNFIKSILTVDLWAFLIVHTQTARGISRESSSSCFFQSDSSMLLLTRLFLASSPEFIAFTDPILNGIVLFVVLILVVHCRSLPKQVLLVIVF